MDECGYDPKFGVVVHRFHSGAYVCKCGKVDVKSKREEVKKYGTLSLRRRRIKGRIRGSKWRPSWEEQDY